MKCNVAPSGRWTYRVQASAQAEFLAVTAEFPPGVPALMGVDRFAHPFLTKLQLCTASGWLPVARLGNRWRLSQCRDSGCAVRYQYDLRRAAEHIDRFGYAAIRGQAILSPPTTWLLHPKNYQGQDTYHFEVHPATGEQFSTGVWSATATSSNVYQASAQLLFEAPYSAFGKLRQATIEVGKSRVNLAIAESSWPLAISDQQLTDALGVYAHWVARYYGRFPVPEVNVIVVPRAGDNIFGMELGNGGASILLFVGREVTRQALLQDWVMTHEMLHLGFPTLPRSHRFWAEGIATYQEALIRARAGLWSEYDMWTQFTRYLPQGQAVQGDRGLGKTQTWGRTYWGGALLCLLLDIELRRASAGMRSLDDFARAVLSNGGNTGRRWEVEQVVQILQAVGMGSSAAAVYRRHTEGGVRIDLEALFVSLGVVSSPAGISFNENAPLAALRRSLVEPYTQAPPVAAKND